VVEADVARSLGAAGIAHSVYQYDPDCTEPAADAAEALLKAKDAHVIIGVGGGKALDLAKLTADAAGVPVVNLPTSAATCAAWTALGNFYSEAGAFRYGRTFPVAPAGIVVDTELIAKAPARLLASGLADTLAKWVETSASVDYAGAEMTTRAAWAMAKFLHDEIRAWGAEAYRDAQAGRLTPVVERAIEANICLAGTVGGLGGERCRSVAAHAVCNALTGMPGNAGSWHGEKVAFGILTQLTLEDRAADAEAMARFFVSIGVPVTLEGLGYHLSDAELDAVAEHVCRPESTAHHLKTPISPEIVKAAMITADRLGHYVSSL
jgi:glycerol dehydrogenase-like iron-containing ADH family enzyme